MKKKITLLMLAFLPMLASIGIQLAAAFLVSFWFMAVSIIRLLLEGITDPELLLTGTATLLLDPLYNDILIAVTFVALAVVFLIWYRKQKDKPVPPAFDEVFCIRNTIIILFAGLAAQIAVSMCLNLILPLFPQTLEKYTTLLESLVGGNVIISVISTAVLAPIAEELIFRELMTKQLRRIFPFWFANIIQALAFGIYHMNIVQGVYAFFLGLLFGYVACRMRAVWASIMLHGIVNASGLVLDIILPDALFESTVGMIIIAVLCGMITILLSMLYHFPANDMSVNNVAPAAASPASFSETPPVSDGLVSPAVPEQAASVSDSPASSDAENNDSCEQQDSDSI